ncbi:MAG: hypothetical protein BWK79_14325 [Beggiatoa sp. IS2]|nr:MAG: hypothetical protein BWK79_14325 [Beggiatoa sp. IS2]
MASFVLVGWLLFTPSAWQRYVANLDPTLPPDFAFVNLQLHHWRQPALWKLLSLIHVLWPLWITICVSICLWLLDRPADDILLGSCYALSFSLISGLLGSLTVSVAFGTMVGIVGGGLLSLPVGLSGDVIFTMVENIAVVIMFSLSGLTALEETNNQFILLTVLLGTFTASQASSITYNVATIAQNPSQHRQIGSVVIGVFTSGFMIFAMTSLTSLSVHSAAKFMDDDLLFTFVYDGLISISFGIAFAVIWIWFTVGWLTGLFLGISISLLFIAITLLKNGLMNAIPWNTLLIGIHGGAENALLYLSLFAFPFALAKRIANSWAGMIAGIFGSAGTYVVFSVLTGRHTLPFILPLVLLSAAFGLTMIWWRPLIFYPFFATWNLLLHRMDEKRSQPSSPSLLRWHSAFWDENQYLPLFGLEHYLVMVAERHPVEGQAAIEDLSSSSQSWAAQQAQIELDARRLQNCCEIKAISQAHCDLAAGELDSPVSALLRSFSRISRDVEAALAQGSSYHQRLALDAVEERLDGLLRELTRSSERYALRFRPIAAAWRQILAETIQTLSEAVEIRQEINNPYIIGVPLTEHQEIFVGRSDVSERIERLLLDQRCPPLLLYGQRRTGKTSLLNNLGRLLPWKIIPLFVDLQGPTSLAKNYEGFLYNLSRTILISAKRHRDLVLPPLTREELQIDPFTQFDEWLDHVEQTLEPEQMALLALDEFSALEHIFNKGLLDEESVLGMFRHIIQHRARFKILLSGSHTIDEFERWASYLINVQTVHINYLQTSEALQLIEHPANDFALNYQPQASQRIIELTHCHPALIQLICAEIVNLKNKQPVSERHLATIADVTAAIPGALQHGRFFFADIANNQVSPHGLEILRFLAQQGEGAVVQLAVLQEYFTETLKTSLAILLQRELLEPVGEGYRFQIELIRRWFIQ